MRPCSGLTRQCGEQRAPVLGLAHLKRLQRETVARHMLLRDRVPTTVFDGHAGFITNRLEADLNVRGLVRRERALSPAEREPFARNPCADATDLECVSVWKVSDEAALFAGLKTKLPVAAWGELEESVRFPPETDLLRKNVERLLRRSLHAQRHDNSGGHFRFRSTCALNDAS